MIVYSVIILLISIFNSSTSLKVTYNVGLKDALKQKLNFNNVTYLNFTERVTGYGYYAEEHEVTTEDGYILKLFRVKSKDCETYKEYPAFLAHGLFVDAISWISAGPKQSLVYLLADSCYDVWVSNTRGTFYSRKHVSLNPDTDADYWKFGIDEEGYLDIPANLDFILKKTSAKKINHAAHSAGSAHMAITLAEIPAYNDVINVSIMMAPAIYISKMKTVFGRFLFFIFYVLEKVLNAIGLLEWVFRGGLLQTTSETLCNRLTVKPFCKFILQTLDNKNATTLITDETLSGVFSSLFMGSSTQNFAQFGQNLYRNQFAKKDYGEAKNLIKYGTPEPPSYDLSKVVAPVVIIQGQDDFIVPPESVALTAPRIAGLKELFTISIPYWNHLDFLYADTIATNLYPKVLEYFDQDN